MVTDTIMAPVHPDEILLEEFFKPLAASQYKLAKEIAVPARRINEIVQATGNGVIPTAPPPPWPPAPAACCSSDRC